MKNITLSADEHLIERARERARAQNTTLNAEFRTWLAGYACQDTQLSEAMEVIRRIREYARTGGQRFTRDELNER